MRAQTPKKELRGKTTEKTGLEEDKEQEAGRERKK